MAKKRATLTDLLNDLTFKCLFDKYKLIAMNAFEWEGLPDGLTARHIENVLFTHGKGVFFKHPSMSHLFLRADADGRVNVYGDPLGYTAQGVGMTHRVRSDDCVIVENNMLRLPTKNFLYLYVNKLTEIERTIDVNVKACKTPVIILCDDKDELSMKQAFARIDGNTPAIFLDKSFNADNIKALDLKASFMANDMTEYKHTVESDLLTFLGINNTPIDKRERLITDEANANNQLIESFFEIQLEARQRACEQINEKYGLKISVRRRVTRSNDQIEEVTDDDPVL